MKKLLNYLNQYNLPWITLIFGAIGLLLRAWQLTTENDRGFIVRGHISGILLFILTAAFLVLLLIAVRPLEQANKYGFNFPASTSGAIGTLIAALIFGLTNFLGLFTAGNTVMELLGILSAVALVFVARCRWKGLHPSTLFHIVVCLWLVVKLLGLYRQWSADPQIQDYCYPLLAMVCLMLTTYQRATFDANFGKRKLYTLFNLAGVYFCCLSVAGPEDIWFYMGAVCWLVTDQCDLTPMPAEFLERTNESA